MTQYEKNSLAGRKLQDRAREVKKKDTHIVQVSCDFLSGFVFLILTIYAVYENWAHMKERNISLLVIGNSENVLFYLFAYVGFCQFSYYPYSETYKIRKKVHTGSHFTYLITDL